MLNKFITKTVFRYYRMEKVEIKKMSIEDKEEEKIKNQKFVESMLRRMNQKKYT
jgi:hypothetical protein